MIETLAKLQGSGKELLRKPSNAFLSWLRERRVPAWLCKELSRNALKRDIAVGVIHLYSPATVRKCNEKFPILIETGFLQIGSGTSGDPVVVRFRGGRGVGYVSHEQLWSDDPEDPADYFLRLADNIGSMAALAIKVDQCPLDFYGTRATLKL